MYPQLSKCLHFFVEFLSVVHRLSEYVQIIMRKSTSVFFPGLFGGNFPHPLKFLSLPRKV